MTPVTGNRGYGDACKKFLTDTYLMSFIYV
jgi:hypothetical protein